ARAGAAPEPHRAGAGARGGLVHRTRLRAGRARARQRAPAGGGTMSAPVAIVAALPEEVGPLRARLRGTRRLPVDAPLALTGRLADRAVTLVVTGDGAGRAQAGITALLEAVAVERLLLVGVAGALCGPL